MKDNNNKFNKGDLVKININPYQPEPAIGIILEARSRGDVFPAYVEILWANGEKERAPIGGIAWTATEVLSRA